MLTTFGCERSSFFSIFCLSWLKYYFLCAEFFLLLLFFQFQSKAQNSQYSDSIWSWWTRAIGTQDEGEAFFQFLKFLFRSPTSVHMKIYRWFSFIRLTVDEWRQPTLLGTTGEFSSFTKEKTSSMIRHLASKNGSRALKAEAHIMRTRLHTRIQTAVSLRSHRRAINVVWYWNIWEETGELYAIRYNVLKLQSKH